MWHQNMERCNTCIEKRVGSTSLDYFLTLIHIWFHSKIARFSVLLSVKCTEKNEKNTIFATWDTIQSSFYVSIFIVLISVAVWSSQEFRYSSRFLWFLLFEALKKWKCSIQVYRCGVMQYIQKRGLNQFLSCRTARFKASELLAWLLYYMLKQSL